MSTLPSVPVWEWQRSKYITHETFLRIKKMPCVSIMTSYQFNTYLKHQYYVITTLPALLHSHLSTDSPSPKNC